MTIYFANVEPIDIAAIEVMGANVKAEGSNPIGYFGTGLKFAIATLLREGQSISLARADGLWRFLAVPEVIRGKTFNRVNIVTPDGTLRPLGFTTDLGRNWKLWQAFRELESNCRDEGGLSGPVLPEGAWGTVFAVEGREFERVWEGREGVFLSRDRKPIVATGEIEVYSRLPSDGKNAIFYRGVLAGELPDNGSIYLYNVTETTQLTEDRTIVSLWWAAHLAQRAWMGAGSRADIRTILTAPKGTWENSAFINWTGAAMSEEFQDVVRAERYNLTLNRAAYERWLDQSKETDFVRVSPTERERAIGEAAFKLLGKLGVQIGWGDFSIVESTGQAYGIAKGEAIYIPRRTFDMGIRFLASTLYEEYIHAKLGLADESRSMQNFLFEKIFALIDPEPGSGTAVPEVGALPSGALDAALRAAGIMDRAPAPEIDDDIPF